MASRFPAAHLLLPAVFCLLPFPPAAAQDAPARVVVTAERTSLSPEERGFSVVTLDRQDLADAPALRLDDVLREQAPGFSLFRRTSSRAANPTTQGVSLRNVGPNGAGRTLVLLDGIPQNDPFGGWIDWSRLPPAGLGRVEIEQGGGAGLFGNAALGGTIRLFSREFSGDALALDAQGGSRATYEFSAAGQKSAAAGALQFSGRADVFESDGFPVVRGSQRGAVDIDAPAEDIILDTSERWNISPHAGLTFKAGVFRERRSGGTPRGNNSTDAADFSLALDGVLPADERVAYQLQAYGQLREYQNFFTSVAPGRATEAPALDQFSVPAQAAGGSATVSLPFLVEGNRLVAGADARYVEGETQERFRFLNGAFTRRREAGGRQVFAGLFAEDGWQPIDGTTLSAAGRVDYYANQDGRRRETDAASGALTRDDHYSTDDGFVADGRLGAAQRLPAAVPLPGETRLRGSIYSGFRVPTLNELYRPFRVRNDLTEANAGLRLERLYGGELGLENHPLADRDALTLSAGGYYNELRDAVGNVTLAQGGTNTPLFGFIPAGGTGRQRQNLPRVRVYGVETSAAWKPAPEWRLELSYLYSRPTVTEAPGAQPDLRGRRLAQAPEHQLTASVRWQPVARFTALAAARVVGDQFEDDLNTLKLAPYVGLDASLAYEFAAGWQARVAVENLLDTDIQTGKSADGLVAVGSPRLVSVGLRRQF